MLQRSQGSAMENKDVKQPFRSRHNSKLKVLVRSHAMREETSPPREPTPNHLISPSIKLTPSPEPEPSPRGSPCACSKPVVVLSPSLSRGASPAHCDSPTSASSPNSRCSPSEEPDNAKTKRNDKEMKTSHARSGQNTDCQNHNCINCSQHNNNNNDLNSNQNISNNNVNGGGGGNMLMVSRTSSRGKLRQQSSSQGSFEGSSSNSPCLSRDSSSEQYTDTTGVDLEVFIPETLNRNAKDRALMLRIEQELVNLARDKQKTHYKFPPMSSYQRMLVHRCAAYFGMDHNIESSGKCVVVNKTKCTRIPDIEFKTHIKEDIVFSEEPRRSILKRDSNSIEDYSFKSPDRSFSLESRKSKSFEEREEEYEKVRRRIFNREMRDGPSEDFAWVEMGWSSTESEYNRFTLQPPEGHKRHLGKLMKVQSEETGETLRPCVAKSYSFGGYGGVSVLSRGDSVVSTHSAGPRLLTKQDSAASSVSWRLSPSSSGYKSQSQMSESVTPSPTSTPHPISDTPSEEQVVWAVTDIHNVPKGSIIINPQTGKALKNEDGTIYHYDPYNPPGFIHQSKPTASPKDKEKKRSSTPVRTKTNTATSPSLPYTPPPPPQPLRAMQFGGGEGMLPPPPQGFQGVFPPPTGGFAPVNQEVFQPFMMYGGGGFGVVPQVQQYEPNEGFYVQEPYQPPYWNQQVFQPQRFAVPVPPYIPSNFVAPPNVEMPVFPNQVQMVYQNPPGVVYPPQQQLVYQNPYQGNGYGGYPAAAQTPTNGFVQEPFAQMAQSMQQLSLGGSGKNGQQFDYRKGKAGGKFGSSKGLIMNSSQSSTGTNSPAATVVSGYCPGQNHFKEATPTGTPNTFFQNFQQPVLYRQMSGVRAGTPSTSRSSRSPTPASDTSQYDRQRVPLPPNLYQGLPYVLQADSRMMNGRGPPNAYRPQHQQSFNKQQHFGSEARSHKNKKTKGNRPIGLPPTGRQS